MLMQAAEREIDDMEIAVEALGLAPHKMGDVLSLERLEAILGIHEGSPENWNLAVLQYRETLEKRWGLFSCEHQGALHILTYPQALQWVEAQQEACLRRMARNAGRLRFLSSKLETPGAEAAARIWGAAVKVARGTIRQMASLARKAVA